MDRSELRAGDADRKRMVAELQRHYVDGRLTEDEYGERVSRTMAARTFGDLDALLRDLPSAPLATPEPATPEPITPEPAAETEEHTRLWDRADFRGHFLTYALVMALLVAIWLLTTPGGYFWPVWPMLGWGIGVASHALAYTAGSSGRRARRRERRRERRERRRGTE